MAGLLPRLVGARRSRLGPGRLHTGTLVGVPVAIAVTGMGAERARRGARALLARGPLAALLSLGFAGALTEALPAGSLVLPERLSLDAEGAAACASDPRLRGRLLAAAGAAGLLVHGGASVTAGRLVTAPAARAALAAAHAADLVDMEGYWLALEARAAGLPFVSVRAVSDALHDDQPVLAAAMAGGRLDLPALLRGYAARPRELARLSRLLAGARAAAAVLERFTLATLTALAAVAREGAS